MKEEKIDWTEWRMPSDDLAHVLFAIVPVAYAPFASSDGAIEWACTNGIVGMMDDGETGGKGVVLISKNSIREMLNPARVGKSASRQIHYAALAKLRELIRAAVIVESHFDLRKGPDMKRSAANGVNAEVLIDVAYAALCVESELYRAKITFKRYRDQNVAGKAYAYHVTKIEVLTGNLVHAAKDTDPKANTPITNQEEANLHLTADILLNGVCDVNGTPLLEGKNPWLTETMKEETSEWLKSSDSKEYFELLKFPTIGADTEHLRDCVACATWLKKWLKSIGADAELVLPGGAGQSPAEAVPVVYGELKGAEGGTTVLLYGHYDVQPPDPVDEWETPPFEPTVRGDRVFCRGAQDDKGQVFAFLCGLRAWRASRDPSAPPPPNVKIVLDGQEESGSVGLFKLLEDSAFRKRLSADVMLVCDTSAAADLRPAIVAGLRGVNHFTVTLTAANRDLHSGEYGGIAPNAAQGMAELMASLHNPDGSIAVDGFCDGIEPPTREELEAAEAGMATKEMYAQDIGTEPCGGEAGKTIVQRNCFEPTIELNGIHSGYGGPGSKTVIPNVAIAKLSTRLVPGQSPKLAYEAVKRHLEERCPKGMKVELSELTGEAPGFRLPLASPLFRLAEDVLKEMDPRGAVFQWDGASIPVVSALRTASGAAPLLVGWGQPEDRIHSPNESYSVRQFLRAKEWAEKVLAALL